MMWSTISSKSNVVVPILLWLAVAGPGFFLLEAYQGQPGHPGKPIGRWPEGCPLALDQARPTLLIFLHPLCPCSGASVAELSSVAKSYRDRFAVHAIVYRPEEPSDEWDRAEAAELDTAPVAGLRRWSDPGGRLARRFGVETSGHVLLFGSTGGLLFGGGITPSRGHRGENLGLESLIAGIEEGKETPVRSPIFGCPIVVHEATSKKEAGQ